MKLKAVLQHGCPSALRSAIESEEFKAAVIDQVLIPHLHMPRNVGPAEFYIQECDVSCSKTPMCEVRLSGVSVNTKRSTNDFLEAARALESLYVHAIESNLSEDDIKNGVQYQLFVALMLDRPPLDMPSSLIERKPIEVPRDGRH